MLYLRSAARRCRPTNNLLLCPAAADSSINHAIWHGGFDCNGVGIMVDPTAPADARFKLFGGFGAPLPNASAGGTGYYMKSADGLHFPTAAQPVVTDARARWDCLPDFRYDSRTRLYTGTIRGSRIRLGRVRTKTLLCLNCKELSRMGAEKLFRRNRANQ